jgi:hypothetical protein
MRTDVKNKVTNILSRKIYFILSHLRKQNDGMHEFGLKRAAYKKTIKYKIFGNEHLRLVFKLETASLDRIGKYAYLEASLSGVWRRERGAR